ncbi:uncharacterized protein YcbK (DUF882 family) [Phyllobacterium brassicacearum]|nr:uncharacterized protein YcbK (DUF882 family) [Phyllobacterium brassicacearum]
MIHAQDDKSEASSFVRASWFVFLMVFASMLFASAQASAETRTLKLYFIHTKERAEITFKKNGRYQQDGLNKLNKFLRDWRRNEPTKMDPRLFDLVWQVYQNVGGRDYINVVSAYRSPATNSMLRSRSRGVATKSQHMLGKAMDWYLPGVKLSSLRVAALKFQAGGVGYYPTSGSPFIHTDVGSVRHWPRMSRRELLAVFPDGKTIHVPSDGKPLPGYEQALAAYESRKRNGSSIQVASASSSGRRGKTLFGVLFGGGADEEEDSSESSVAVASAPTQSRTVTAKAAPAADSEEGAAPPAPAATAAKPAAIAPDLPTRAAPAPLNAPRPEAPLAITAEDNQALAFAVPVPLRRPDYTPTPAPGQPDTLNALAEEKPTVVAALPTPRPQDSASAIRDMIAANVDDANTAPAHPEMVNALVPVPFDKPHNAPKPTDMMVASVVPNQRPVTPALQTAAEANPDIIQVPEEDDLTPEAIIKQSDTELKPQPELPTLPGTTGGRVVQAQQNAQMASAEPQPSLRRTMLEAKGDPVAMLDSGVVTTTKSSKPRRQTAQAHNPKAIQVSSDLPDRALSTQQVAETSPDVEPAVLRNETMRTAPTTVYTAGFQQNLPVADANKFTGKAVTFLQIAKFNSTNGS